MRLHFRLSPNDRLVPWDYQQNLSGWLYKQLGEDSELHEGISLYSLSDLSHGRVRQNALDFEGGSSFFLSSQRDDILIELMTNLLKPSMPNSDRDPKRVAWGMYVEAVDMQREPEFGETATFWAKSPVLVRKRREDGSKAHVLFDEADANELLTRTLHTKMEQAGLEPKGTMRFDRTYGQAKSKMVTYKGVKSRGSLCPVIVDGGADVCAFAWNVGAGHSTGIGFGALEMMK